MDNNILVTTGDKKIKIWNISTQELIKEIKQPFHSQFMNDVYIDSRKKYVFAEKTKYNFATSQKIKSYPFSKMYFFKDKYYTLNLSSGKISQYDVFSDQLLKTYSIDSYKKGNTVFFNETKGLLFIGFTDGADAVDIQTGTKEFITFDRSLTFENLSIVSNFEFSADRNFFIASSNQGKDNRTGGDGHLAILAFDKKGNRYKEIYRDSRVTNEVIALHHSNKAVISRTNSFELIDLDRTGEGIGLIWEKSKPLVKSISEILYNNDDLIALKHGGETFHVMDVKHAYGDKFSSDSALKYFDLVGFASFDAELGFCKIKENLSAAAIPPELTEFWQRRKTYSLLNLANGHIQEADSKTVNTEFKNYSSTSSVYGTVTGKNYSPSGKYYAVETSFKGVTYYANDLPIVTGPTSGVIYHIEYSADERYSAFGGSDRKVTVVDLSQKRVVHALWANSYITSICFSRDNKYVFSGSLKNEILMHDIASGKLIRTFTGSNGSITDIQTTREGKYLFSAGNDNALRIWDIASGKLMMTAYFDYAMNYLMFTPDGYFDKSENFYGKISYKINGNAVSFDQLYEKYYRPDIIRAIISGGDSKINTLANSNNGIIGIKAPPKIYILAIDPQSRGVIMKTVQEVAGGPITISVTATDQGGGIKGIRVLNNKKIIEEKILTEAIHGDSLNLVVQLDLNTGVNIIEAIGIAADLTESKPFSIKLESRRVNSNVQKPNLYILSAGINDYKNSKYNLNYCVADMESFTDSLKNISADLFGSVIIRKVKNNEATKDNLLKLFADIAKTIHSNDVFIFYYAGHGIAIENENGTDFFLVLNQVTQMTDKNNCTMFGISGTEIKQQLKIIRANKQLLFIDACQSGALAEGFFVRGAAEEIALAKLSRTTGSAIFASTTKEQYAAEFSQLNHGVFTYVLLNGFKGEASLRNCQITAASLKAYIDDQVPVYTQKYKGSTQYPTTFMFGQDFPIGIRCNQE